MAVLFLVLSCAAQEHWSCGSADAASAYLQAGGIERLLLLMPKRQPPPGCEPGEVRVARGSIHGTRDAGRSWYQHFRDRLANKFRVAASSLAPMELCGTQRSPETMLTYSEHREYRSLLGKLQWLQLQSRPDLSYEVNCAAQRSSAPTVADVRALDAMSHRSAILGNHFEISTWSDQCFLGSAGDVWRSLLRQHGRFEESVRRHRVFDA